MPLPIGTRIGPYEITGTLGAGGMGEVYRARDARLARDVALKVLPEVFAADPERLARFQREAQVLAALKHPSIGAIYGLEENALVLELVEGETLADRIARGPIPIDEALPMATQIAEALQAAHEQGIVHRDLKPSNIKVQPDGSVKVLDFGLAKLTEAGGAGQAGRAGEAPLAHLSMSPTLTSPAATGLGVVLGTAAYMAPEQAKGRPADKRSDVWAFGCVLFEMLSGKRAFDAEDVSDTLALVLKGEPDWRALPIDLPVPIRSLTRACLHKEARQRLADVSGVSFVLTHHSELVPVVDRRSNGPWWRRYVISAVSIATAAVVSAATVWLVRQPSKPTASRFFITSPERTTFVTGARQGTSAAISPDGGTLAFTAKNADGKIMLWLRPIDSLAAQPLAGTEDAQLPFWSPDSRSVGYFTQNKLMKVAIGGGPPQIVSAVSNGRGGTWARTGEIVYSTTAGPLFRIQASGGSASQVTQLASGQINHRFPSFLPDARNVLYYAQGVANVAGLHVVNIETGRTQRLTQSDSSGVYDSKNGYVLFARQGILLAQRLDPRRMTLSDESVPVAEHVESGVYTGVTAFSLSDTGVLAYGIGGPSASEVTLVWIDRAGKAIGPVGPSGAYIGLDLSRDGERVAVHRHEETDGGDIWVTSMSRGTTSRVTFDNTQDYSSPAWSPDGERIAFGLSSSSSGNKGLFARSANGAGAEVPLLQSGNVIDDLEPQSWAPDGKSLLYMKSDLKGGADLWILPLDGVRKPMPLLATPFSESHAQISPDGRWFAYQSNETGQQQVYVRPFPSGDGKWQVSTGDTGGFAPRWRADGRELFYLDTQSPPKMMAVSVDSTGPVFQVGVPVPLFDSGYIPLNQHGGQPHHAYAVSPDGQRFLIPISTGVNLADLAEQTSSPIAVVLNWAQGIRH